MGGAPGAETPGPPAVDVATGAEGGAVFQVLMEDGVAPAPPEEVRSLVRRCLQEAAHVNYSQLLEYAQIKGSRIKEGRIKDKRLTCRSAPVQPELRPLQRDAWRS